MHRAALFGVLFRAAEAAGIAIETGIELETIDTGGQRATLITADGRELGGFDLVVDATGARSKLKRLANNPSEPKPLAYGAFWASLGWRGEGFDAHALLQRYHRASMMIGVLPIGRPQPDAEPMAAFFWSLKPEEADMVRAAGLTAWKDRVAGLWPECQAYLGADRQLRATGAGALWPSHAGPPGRAAAGDHRRCGSLDQPAARARRQHGAARCSARWRMRCPSADVEEALQAYAKMRRLHVRVFQALSFAFTPFYQSDSTVLPFIRDRLVATIARIPPGPRFLASMVAGTVIDPFGPMGLTETDWRGLCSKA